MAALVFPPSPAVGDEFTGPYGEVYTWDGMRWTLTVGESGSGGASVTIGSTPPTNPAPGWLWWDTVSGQLFVWYDDGTSAQWVQANGGGAASSALTLPTTGVGGIFALQDQPTINQPVLMGVTDGSNAAPGQVGEYLSVISLNGPFTGSGQIPATLNVPPGDWDICGYGALLVSFASPLPWVGGTYPPSGYVTLDIRSTPTNVGPGALSTLGGVITPVFIAPSGLGPWGLLVYNNTYGPLRGSFSVSNIVSLYFGLNLWGTDAHTPTTIDWGTVSIGQITGALWARRIR